MSSSPNSTTPCCIPKALGGTGVAEENISQDSLLMFPDSMSIVDIPHSFSVSGTLVTIMTPAMHCALHVFQQKFLLHLKV